MTSSAIGFVSLGMVVLDELRLPDGRVFHGIGGSGAYSTLGARLTAAAQPETVGSLIVAGGDFPKKVIELIESWGVSLDLLVKSGNQHGDFSNTMMQILAVGLDPSRSIRLNKGLIL